MSYHETMADRQEARETGRQNPDRAWICSNRDVWHRNPFYVGPEQPHPEDDDAHEFIAEHGIEAWRNRAAQRVLD